MEDPLAEDEIERQYLKVQTGTITILVKNQT